MRLIDADIIYKFSLRSLERLDKPLDYLDGWNDAIDALEDNAPTIDAIPVEWILKNPRMPRDGKPRKAILDMIEEWRAKE